MKKVFFLLVLLAATLGSQAQDSTRHYASFFGKNSTEWTTGWHYPTQPHVEFHTYSHWVSGDTIIGDYTYKRILSDPKNYEFYLDRYDGAFDSTHILPFYMREDTLTGRLWIRHAILPNEQEDDTTFVERLVCDMSLEMNDSIRLTGAYSCLHRAGTEDYSAEYLYVVTQADEYNGLRRLKLECSTSSIGTIYFYEGIGNDNLFLPMLAGINFSECFSMHGFSIDGNVLGCVIKDDTISFSNPLLDQEIYIYYNCEFHMTGSVDESNPLFAVTLYPNPCGEQLQIENLPEGVQSLYITDMLGQRVYSTTQPTASIPSDWFAPGAYQLTLVLPNNRHHTLTFVKR